MLCEPPFSTSCSIFPGPSELHLGACGSKRSNSPSAVLFSGCPHSLPFFSKLSLAEAHLLRRSRPPLAISSIHLQLIYQIESSSYSGVFVTVTRRAHSTPSPPQPGIMSQKYPQDRFSTPLSSESFCEPCGALRDMLIPGDVFSTMLFYQRRVSSQIPVHIFSSARPPQTRECGT